MKINYYKVMQDELDSMPFNEGSLYRTTDTNRLYIDPVGGGTRELLEIKTSGGIDTSDATAGADNIENGYTAYVNNVKVVGSILKQAGSKTVQVVPQIGYNIGRCILMRYQPTEKQIFGPDCMLDLVAPFSDFGTATPEDVTAGKTFTSSSGFLNVGTRVD